RLLGGHVGVGLCPEGHLVPDQDRSGGEGGGGAAGLLDDHGVVAGRQRGYGERVQGAAAERFRQLPAPVVAGVDAVPGVVEHRDGQVHGATVAAQVDRQGGRPAQAQLTFVPAAGVEGLGGL